MKFAPGAIKSMSLILHGPFLSDAGVLECKTNAMFVPKCFQDQITDIKCTSPPRRPRIFISSVSPLSDRGARPRHDPRDTDPLGQDDPRECCWLAGWGRGTCLACTKNRKGKSLRRGKVE